MELENKQKQTEFINIITYIATPISTAAEKQNDRGKLSNEMTGKTYQTDAREAWKAYEQASVLCCVVLWSLKT